MTADPITAPLALALMRPPVDQALVLAFDEAEHALDDLDPLAPLLLEEVRRLVLAGGKRLRPAFCLWGYEAARGVSNERDDHIEPDPAIVRVAAAIELLHTMALIHDDLMDGADRRRGVEATAPHLARVAVERGFPAEPQGFGRAGAVLVGDLAAVLADRVLLTSGVEPAALVRALAPYHAMRLDMAAGQLLDISGLARSSDRRDLARRAARLKGGSYTVAGPLRVGAAIAEADTQVRAALEDYGSSLGEAFQLQDDLLDGDGAHGASPELVTELVERARASLRGVGLSGPAARALDELAIAVGTMVP